MKLAIVHDFLLSYGGAERVLEHVHEMFPNAPVFTLRYDENRMHGRMKNWDVRSSIIEKMPIIKKRGHTMAMPFYPLAIESFDFSQFDVVLSLSSAFTHGVITQPKTKHICYYHTPTRFLWDYHFEYLKEKGWDKGIKGVAIQRFLHRLRQWDFLAAQRPDVVIANSQTVASRIKKFYRRQADVIYPGLDAEKYSVAKSHDDYYLTACRLTPPKKVDLAVIACTQMGRNLHVVGSGEELERLKKMAGPTIKFLGFLDDEALLKEMSYCRALIWPNVDDFGLVPVEVMACGRPVIAYNEGGATETVVDNKTGVLFDDHSVNGVRDAITRFESQESNFLPTDISKHAKMFSKTNFQNKLRDAINSAVKHV